MAFGDPMVFETIWDGIRYGNANYQSLLVNGPIEEWDNTAAAPNGWLYTDTFGGVTHLRVAGTRTGGAGAYFHRISYGSGGTGALGAIGQSSYVKLYGDKALPGYGHDNVPVSGSIWLRNTGVATCSYTVNLLAYADDGTTLVQTVGTTSGTLTGTWTQYSVSGTITNDSAALLQLQVVFTRGAVNTAVFEIDEALLTISYTLATSPSWPDDGVVQVPFRSFARGAAGSLIRHRTGAHSGGKHQWRFNFGLMGQAQYDRLKSLWLLDCPLRVTPNLPHLPTYFECRWVNDFDFAMHRASVASVRYQGTMVLSEL